MNIFKARLKLVKGTRFVSFLFIGVSVLIAAGILIAANMYYNIDTGEVVVEEIKRVTGVLRATGGAIVGGTASQNPEAGYVFEVVGQTKLATTTIATGYLSFAGSDTYAGFQAPSSYGTTTAMVYKLPQHGTYPPQTDYVLTWQPGNQLLWKEVSGVTGAGDITAVGDCLTGDCFTADGAGNQLWFEGATADINEIILTAADPTADYTITLPAANGYVALGTGQVDYVAYWTGNNTLGSEQYLATSRGGLGANVTAAGAGELLYSVSATAYDTLAAGTLNQILTSGGAAAPSWTNIANLINVTNGLTESGETVLTVKLGGPLTELTTITQENYDLIFNLTGTGDFKVQDNGVDIFTVTDDGRILFKTYPLAEPGKQILREMIPILGFDLPVQTATTSYVQISRTIEDYPFSPASSGTTRVHKFVIRYADATTTASTTWRVYNETSATTTATFEVPATASTDLGKGEAYITSNVTIPTNTDDWRLELMTPGTAIRVYQIFLAAYDQIQ